MSASRNVDIHCHLLPQWDDGPRSLQAAVEMARRAAENGITDILVTPHVGRDLSGIGVRDIPAADEIPAAVRKLQNTLQGDGLNLKLWPGAELVIAPDLPDRIEKESNLTTGAQQRYALVELLPGAPWTDGVDDVLFQIALRGVTPIVAHPERYADVQRNFDLVQRAADRGILFQLTAASLLSKGKIRDTAHRLLDAGLISFVASDAHGAQDIWPQRVQEKMVARLGEAAYEKLQCNALALLPAVAFEGNPRPIDAVTPVQPSSKSGDGRFENAKSSSWWKLWRDRSQRKI